MVIHLSHLAAWGVTGISLVRSCSRFGRSSGPPVRVLSPCVPTVCWAPVGHQGCEMDEIRDEVLTHTTTWMNFQKKEKTMVSKRSQTQKTTCHMIPRVWRVQEKQIYRYRKQISGCLGLGLGMASDGHEGVRGRLETSLNWTRWWLHSSVDLCCESWIIHLEYINLMVYKLYFNSI